MTLGVFAAYVVGKPLGILGAAWLGTRPALGGARLTITWPALVATAASAGIGFTVSLLVAALAFHGQLLDEAKLGVLATAVVSPALSWLAVRVMSGCRPRRAPGSWGPPPTCSPTWPRTSTPPATTSAAGSTPR